MCARGRSTSTGRRPPRPRSRTPAPGTRRSEDETVCGDHAFCFKSIEFDCTARLWVKFLHVNVFDLELAMLQRFGFNTRENEKGNRDSEVS